MAMVGAARQAGRAAALVAAACGLWLSAACSMMQPEPMPVAMAPPTVVAPPDEVQPTLPPRPAHKPAPPALAALTPPKAEAEPPPTAEVSSFDKLQGLDQQQMMALLGEPAQRAEAPPAVLWRYANADCALDVYFYLDLQSREMRILHYEVRNTDGSQRPQQRCYDEFVTARAAEPTGSSDRPR
jgi:hypothetical protein